MTKLSESLLAEFDEKFVEINAINYKDKVLSGRDETTVIRLKQFLSTAITRIEKEAREQVEAELRKEAIKNLREMKVKGVSYDKGSNSRGYQEGRNQTIDDLISNLTKERKDK